MPGEAIAFGKKSVVWRLGIDTLMSSVYTLPPITANLLAWIIAGVTSWLV
jgi:hypothetical protein